VEYYGPSDTGTYPVPRSRLRDVRQNVKKLEHDEQRFWITEPGYELERAVCIALYWNVPVEEAFEGYDVLSKELKSVTAFQDQLTMLQY